MDLEKISYLSALHLFVVKKFGKLNCSSAIYSHLIIQIDWINLTHNGASYKLEKNSSSVQFLLAIETQPTMMFFTGVVVVQHTKYMDMCAMYMEICVLQNFYVLYFQSYVFVFWTCDASMTHSSSWNCILESFGEIFLSTKWISHRYTNTFNVCSVWRVCRCVRCIFDSYIANEFLEKIAFFIRVFLTQYQHKYINIESKI